MTLEQAASCCITTWRSPPSHSSFGHTDRYNSKQDWCKLTKQSGSVQQSRCNAVQCDICWGGGGHAIIKLHNHVNSGCHIWGRFKVSFGLLPDSAKTCLQFKSAPVSLLLMDGHFGLDTEDKCQCHATLMYSSLEQSLSVSLLVDARFRFRWNCWTPC